MSIQSAANPDQVAYWNNAVGETWATLQDKLDRQIDPLGLVAMAAAVLREDPSYREAVVKAVEAMMAPLDGPDGVLLDSATWIVTARRP